jgi:pyruvate dehydrogenase E2 component (dihydrolipoamide acetyltransferase)
LYNFPRFQLTQVKGGDFMKKVTAIIVSVLFVLSVAGLSFAAEQKAAPAPAEKKEAAPAKTEMKKEEKKAPAKIKRASGEVAAVDAKTNTLTVKGKKGDVTVTADDKTVVKIGKDKKSLADVKAGDKVTVKYAEVDGKNVAKGILVSAAPAKTEMKKEEKKKEAAPAAAPAAPAEKKPAEKKKTGGY